MQRHNGPFCALTSARAELARVCHDRGHGSAWVRRKSPSGPARLAGRDTALLGQQPSRGEFQRVCVAAQAVIGGHEVVADRQGEGEDAAGFGLLLVAADRAE